MSQESGIAEKDFTFEEFLFVHQNQLESSCVPQLYWATLFKKLKDEIYDAGQVFQIQCVEDEAEDEESEEDEESSSSHSWRVVVNEEEGIKCMDKKHIYLVDHAWTYRVHEAREYLTQVAGLKERMAALMEVPTEDREEKEIVDHIMKEMWKFNNTYSLGNFELVAVPCSYSPQHLIQLMGDCNTEITDDIITAALNLMKANCGPTENFYIGYYLPAQIHLFMSFGYSTPHGTIPVDKSSINIHPLTGHWVTSYYDVNTHIIHVYDSLMSDSHQAEVFEQIKVMYGHHIADRLLYENVTQQSILPVCGIMAIAFAFTCFLQQNPVMQTYDIQLSRSHLQNCILSGEVKPFPVIRDWFDNYISDQALKEDLVKKRKLDNYAVSEKTGDKNGTHRNQSKLTQRQLRKHEVLEHKKDKTRKKKHRQLLSENECDVLKHKDKTRKQEQRSSLSDHKSDALKIKDKVRKQKQRQSLSEHEREVLRVRDKVRKQKQRQSVSENQSEILTARDKSEKQKQKHSLIQDEHKIFTNRDKARKQKQRQTVSEPKRQMLRARDNARKQEERQSLSKDNLEILRNTEKARKQKKRQTLSQQEHELLTVADNARKQEERQSLSKDNLEMLRNTEKARKQKKRQTLSQQEHELLTVADNARKQEQRQSLSKDNLEMLRNTEKARKQKKMQTLSQQEHELLTVADNARKQEQRQSLSKDNLEMLRNTEKTKKQKKRQTLSQQEHELLTVADKARKQKERQSVSEYKHEKVKHKDKTRKQNKRQSVSEHEREMLKDIDRIRKGSVRKRTRSEMTQENLVQDRNKQAEKKKQKRHRKDIGLAITRFKTNIKQFAKYICTCCNRLLYKRSVVRVCKRVIQNMPEKLQKCCISGEKSALGFEWLCTTCRGYLDKQKLPPQSEANKMKVPDAPAELSDLTSLEVRLLCKRYPFMKLVALPKGRQNAIKGSVVNVPVNCEEVCSTLPRTPGSGGIIPLRLKRKLQYKNCEKFQYVRPDKIITALKWLQKHNNLYQNVEENVSWLQECKEHDEDMFDEIASNNKGLSDEGNNTIDDDATETEEHSQVDAENSEDPLSKLRGVNYDTCIQSANPMLDVDKIVSIAPGENKVPISLLMDEHFEEMAFPKLFPTGKFGFKAERPVKISAKKYFQKRLLDASGNFARDIEYLFVAQTITERKQITDSMSIALRKSFTADQNQSLTAEIVRDASRLRQFIFKDQAYRYLQPIRGTPPYWQRVQLKLLAAIKQFGIFTWFFTVSAADLKWHDTLQEILSQQGRTLNDSQIDALTWEQKCNILRSNPVSAARHFQFRLDQFMKEIILSDAQPLAEVEHFFYRIEFQQRGSPHAHGVLWIKDAPDPQKDSPETVAKFVDRYVRCTLPSADTEPELYSLVNQLQRHTHTASCRVSGKGCRFGYPRPISLETVLSKPPDINDTLPHFIQGMKEQCKQVLSVVKTYLEQSADVQQMTYEEVLQNCHLTPHAYQTALSKSSSSPKIYLKRDPQDIMINNYNPSLLLAWQANLDVQYVIDPYACIQYVVAYITKDEREMGTMLQALAKESAEETIKDQMKKCGQAFLNARSVTAQEAAYRALGLPLFKSNFTTVWIPTGLPSERVSLLKPAYLLDNLDNDDQNVFVSGIAEKYSHRPPVLETWCLAQFASWYEMSQEKYANKNDFQPDVLENCMKDSCGTDLTIQNTSYPKTINIDLSGSTYIMKKRNKQAVIRFHKFSQEKQPESFYHSQLYLFFPWRNEAEDLLQHHESYLESYSHNKDTATKIKDQFYKHEELVEAAYEQFFSEDQPVDAWDELAAETQHEHYDDVVEEQEIDEEHEIVNPNDHPNLSTTLPTPSGRVASLLPLESMPSVMPYDDYCKHIQSLNIEQYTVLQSIMDWCITYVQSVQNKNIPKPKPIHLFITGGAGTGKSHLITAIYQTINLLLRKEGDNPDCPKVLLLAPTGTAAFNIDGVTIHAGLRFGIKKNQTNAQLSDEKRNTLRVKLYQLQFLIIDEISMVGSDFFVQIHNRLAEIFGCSDIFGGLNIISVGDMYQLPPVYEKFIFEPPRDPMAALSPSLWSTYFTFMQLTKIMRQADDVEFSELLNRLRTGSHMQQDIDALKSRIVNDDDPNIDSFPHVFVKNTKVDEHNLKKLNQLPGEKVILTAVDRKPSSLKNFTFSDNERYTGGLRKTVTISVGARVLLVCNVDVSDGLANGSQGTVIDILFTPSHTPSAVMVLFDSPNVGKNARINSKFNLSKYNNRVVPITPFEITFSPPSSSTTQVSRSQFPLRLSWAMTIHKVQGATLSNIVVSFENHFQPGQAYVACSRVKKLTDLYITNFNEKKIITSATVKKEMTRMQDHSLHSNLLSLILHKQGLTVALLNARSARNHFKDIITHPVLNTVDILCLTEANVYEDQLQHYQRDGWKLTSLPHSIDENCHGILLYTPDQMPVIANYSSFVPHMEQVSVTLSSNRHPRSFCLLYRSPSSLPSHFIEDITDVVEGSNPDIVLGDFNFNMNTSNYMKLLKTLPNYNQCIHHPTHRSGSTIDLVFTRNGLLPSKILCLPTYFTDHSVIFLQFDM